ncbi:MAG: hypothetical protein WBO95_03345 [Candidatus Dechloromonas phosphoritropha]
MHITHLIVPRYEVKQLDTKPEYDRALPASTFFVESDIDVRGSASLYPFVSGFHFN